MRVALAGHIRSHFGAKYWVPAVPIDPLEPTKLLFSLSFEIPEKDHHYGPADGKNLALRGAVASNLLVTTDNESL